MLAPGQINGKNPFVDGKANQFVIIYFYLVVISKLHKCYPYHLYIVLNGYEALINGSNNLKVAIKGLDLQ